MPAKYKKENTFVYASKTLQTVHVHVKIKQKRLKDNHSMYTWNSRNKWLLM